jgi:hypothetical protein
MTQPLLAYDVPPDQLHRVAFTLVELALFLSALLPSTRRVAKNVIGGRIPKSRKYGLCNRMAIAPENGSGSGSGSSGSSEECSGTAILRSGTLLLGIVMRAAGTAGPGETARSKSMRPSLARVVRSRAGGSGTQRSRSSPT